MLFPLILTLVIAGAGLVSAAGQPTYARADFVPGDLGPLSGTVIFIAAGDGVIVSLDISGFPEEGGPWPYHLHQYSVIHNDCSTSGPPFALSNETNIPVPCPRQNSPKGCRAGDMAGQFGNLTSSGTEMSATYYDPYISLDPDAPNYIGNLSFNVHWANFTAIACCNIELGANQTPNMTSASASASTSASASNIATATSGLPLYTGGASSKRVGRLVFAAAAGLTWFGVIFG